jgi:hypothetical protein
MVSYCGGTRGGGVGLSQGGGMEEWSIEHEGPHLRSERSALPWIVAALVVAVVAGLAYAYYRYVLRPETPAPAAKTEAAPAPQAKAPPPTRHLLPEPAPEAKPLPTLENSDSMMRGWLAGLLGRQAFDRFVIPNHLIRRVVATVDNLPRRTLPRRVVPIHSVPGAFVTAGTREAATLTAANFARYTPYVDALEKVEAGPLVTAYVQAYPLFQKAYEELGYPDKYFNERLLEAIDDLLAAPEIEAPVPLAQPKVLYTFADPDLESRSAGQKVLVRMGAGNARRVKAWLRAVRQDLAARSTRR